jgi:DNA-binding IclR family transcriptional regulator
MAGFDRYENILKLFTQTHSSWTVVEMSARLGGAASTTYRTVRELVAAGFLESAVEAQYRLGPALMEFEHVMRVTDPLVRAGPIFLESLVEQVTIPCTALLARLYGERVMCVAKAGSPIATQPSSYRRGRPMPILLGATSKAVLAGLTSRRRTQLMRSVGPKDPAQHLLLAAELDRIRKVGVSITSGEVDQGAVGVAVSIQNKSLGINASLSLIFAASEFGKVNDHTLTALLTSHARLIENFIEDAYQDILRRVKPEIATL